MVEGIARWNLALAEWLYGRLAEAEGGFSSIISRWRAVGERGLGAVMRDHLGQVQRAQGRLDAAHNTYEQTLAINAHSGGPAMPAAGAGHVGLAELAYERNELDTSPAARHRGHPAVPPVRLLPAAGCGPGDFGVDPAGHR